MARSCGCDLMESLSCHEGLLLSFPSASLPCVLLFFLEPWCGLLLCALRLPKPLDSSRRRMTRKASCLLVRSRRQESRRVSRPLLSSGGLAGAARELLAFPADCPSSLCWSGQAWSGPTRDDSAGTVLELRSGIRGARQAGDFVL